jgi:hypothetical protein
MNDRAQNQPLAIRPYKPADRKSIRKICQMTAFRNRGYSAFFEDGELFADYWTEYYLKYEPDLCFVAEGENGVVGYLLGCSNSSFHMDTLKKKILPRLLLKCLFRVLTFRYRRRTTYRYLRWLVIKSWREIPPIPAERFPAHYHSNLLREASHRHGFSGLLIPFLDELEARGVPGLYGIVQEPKEGGIFSKLFSKSHSIGIQEEYFAEIATSMYKDVLGEKRPMVNRIYASNLASYQKFVHYVSHRYGL